jgi:hypothetical protein
MPPLDESWSLGATVALGAGAFALTIALPPVAACLAGFYAWATISHRKHLAKMRAERPGESICTFARAFDLRETDPWIVRAVWDELQIYVRIDGEDFPLRATDSIDSDLDVDPEDLDLIAARVAKRVGRSLADVKYNPHYGSVRTAGDLIHFLNFQPVAGARGYASPST